MRKILTYENVFSVLCLLFVATLLYYSITLFETRQRYGIIFLFFSIALSVFTSLKGKPVYRFLKGNSNTVMTGLIILTSIVGAVYFWMEFWNVTWERSGAYTTVDVILGAIAIYLVVQFAWRTSGPHVPIVALFCILYAVFGQIFPGILYHPGISIRRVIEVSAVSIDGIFGIINQVAATWIAIFIFFAGFVQGFKGVDFIMKVVRYLLRKSILGVPQIAVVSSMLFGCFSGSGAANAAGTGVFTIPLMKKYGFNPAFAGAVESVASSGGQIMPPVLGAAAFLMAEFLGRHYLDIVKMSVAPALLFYSTCALGVYLMGRRRLARSISNEQAHDEIKGIKRTELLRGLPMLAGGTSLVVFLVVVQLDILICGFVAIAIFLLSQFIYEMAIASEKKKGLAVFMGGIVEGARGGAETAAEIGLMCGTMGIIIALITTTGLTEKIAYYSVIYFGGHLYPLLIVTMVVVLIFGMAVSTVADYLLAVMLAAPALTKLGVPLEIAHFAVFYWAILSGMTPPVAGVCVVTSKIAGASYLRTCLESMRLSFPVLFMPFLFLKFPALLSFSWKSFFPFFFSFFALGGMILVFNLISKNILDHSKRLLYCAMGFGGIFLPLEVGVFLVAGVIVLFVLDYFYLGRRRAI